MTFRRLIFTLALAALGCAEPANSPAGIAQARPPDFELPALDGTSVRLSEHLGKEVILIDFWATFCKPCLQAMPELDALYKKHRARGLLVLGISIDAANQLDEVRADVEKSGVTFPILLDQETRVVGLYNPKSSAPFSVLIGRDGRIARQQEGYTAGDGAALERDIELALRQ